MESEREEGELSDDEVTQISGSGDAFEKSTPAPNNSPASTRQDECSRDSVSSLGNGFREPTQPKPSSYRDMKAPGLSSSDDDSDEDDDYYGSAIKRAKHKVHSSTTTTWQNPLLQNKGGLKWSSESSRDASAKKVNMIWNNEMSEQAVVKQTSNTWSHVSGNGSKKVNNVWGSVMEEQSQPQRKNNVWGNVMQEQLLQMEFGGVGMKKLDQSDRDVESYDFTKAAEDDRSSVDSSDSDSSEEEKVKVPDLADKETFGYDESKPKAFKKSMKHRLGKRKHDMETEDGRGDRHASTHRDKKLGHALSPYMGEDGDEDKKENRKRRFGESHNTGLSIKDRLGTIMYPPETELRVDDPPEKILCVLAQRLDEPKVDLLERVLENIGAKSILRLLYMTEDIEATGGMMTMNGLRRRTTGGVFLTLLKDDKHISQEEKDRIFEDDRKAYRKKLKAKRKQRKRRRNPPKLSEAAMDVESKKDDVVEEDDDLFDLEDHDADIVLE